MTRSKKDKSHKTIASRLKSRPSQVKTSKRSRKERREDEREQSKYFRKLPEFQRPVVRIPLKRDDVPLTKQAAVESVAQRQGVRVHYLGEGYCLSCSVLLKDGDPNAVRVSTLPADDSNADNAVPGLACKKCLGGMKPHSVEDKVQESQVVTE